MFCSPFRQRQGSPKVQISVYTLGLPPPHRGGAKDFRFRDNRQTAID